LLAGYGPPGCAAVLAALSSDAYPGPRNRPRCAPLHRAVSNGVASVVEVLLAAYGPPGCAPVLAALAADDSTALREAARSRDAALLAALLRAYGAPGSPALLEALDATDALRATVLARQTAMAAAVLAAHGEPGCPALIAALAENHHWALQYSTAAEEPSLAVAILRSYGPPGSEGVLAALADDSFPGPGGAPARCTPLHRALACNFVALSRALLAAHGPPGCAAVVAALGHDGHAALARAPSSAIAAAVLYALGTRAGAGALVAAMAADEPLRAALGLGGGHGRVVDTPWALEAVQSPEAWGPAGARRDAARLLLSPGTRAALLLPVLLALRSMPPGAAKSMQLFLRDRPWLLYGATLPGSAPPGDAAPPALEELGDDGDGAAAGDEPPGLEEESSDDTGSGTSSWATDDEEM
jgi:hypothetical protein